MIYAEHGQPATELVAVARLFRFRDSAGYGNSTEAGYLAVKPHMVVDPTTKESKAVWLLSINGIRLMEMEPSLLRDGAPCLVGSFALCYYILVANPPKRDGTLDRGPQATLYVSQTPPLLELPK